MHNQRKCIICHYCSAKAVIPIHWWAFTNGLNSLKKKLSGHPREELFVTQ